MNPQNSDPIMLDNLDEDSMVHLTKVPPVKQDILKVPGRYLDWVLVMNKLDLEIEEEASHEELADFVYNKLVTRGYKIVSMQPSPPAGQMYVPICYSCNAVEADQLFADCKHWSICTKCLDEAFLTHNPVQAEHEPRMAPCPRCQRLSQEGRIIKVNV